MNQYRYRLSFTTGGLFHNESVKLAALYLELGDWNFCREKVIAENLLQTRTLSTLKRVYREVSSRLGTLTQDETAFLAEAGRQDQAYLLWLAVCRRYRFIAEFAVEVLRERYLSLKPDLAHGEFDAFFNRKSEWNAELDEITPSTRSKLRQVLFRILKEASLLTANHLVIAALPGPRLMELIRHGRPGDVLCFPMVESDVQGAKP